MVERRVSNAATSRSVSESKTLLFFWTALSMVGLTAALVRRTRSWRRIAARWVHQPAWVGVVTQGMIAKASEAAMLKAR